MDSIGKRTAIGLIRVSKVGDRKGDRFISPKDQRSRIERFCAEHGITLLEIVDEFDVSGGSSMLERAGLGGILTDIEMRRCGADSLVVAYFDRLARSTEVGQEVMRRLVAANGHLYVAEEGEQKIDTPDAWFIFTVKMATAELYRRQAGAKTHAAKANAILRGVPTFANIPPGYVRSEAGPLMKDALAPVMLRAYEMRGDESASWNQVRGYLRANGIKRTLRGVVNLLASRIYLGELHFGELENLKAHQPIVPLDLWMRVQHRQKTRGRYSQEPRLLSRLGVLKCGNCKSAMHVGANVQAGKTYRDYRCPGRSAGVPCSHAMTVHATVIEPIVEERVQRDLAQRAGTLNAEDRVTELEARLRETEAERDNIIAALTGLDGVAAARAKIAEAQGKVTELEVQVAAARADADPIFHVYANKNWSEFTLDEKRRLIRASFCAIEIHPGRGLERVKFFSTGQESLLV